MLRNPTYTLPKLPHIHEVRQIVQSGRWEDDTASVVMICPDPMAGRPNRYSVIRIHRFTGKVTCIGRELPLREAREIAHRPESQDSKPLWEAALRQNLRTLRLWEKRAQEPPPKKFKTPPARRSRFSISPEYRKYARKMVKIVQREVRAIGRAIKLQRKKAPR